MVFEMANVTSMAMLTKRQNQARPILGVGMHGINQLTSETCTSTEILWSPTFAIQPLVQQYSAKFCLLGFAATQSTIDFLPAMEGQVILRSLFTKPGASFFSTLPEKFAKYFHMKNLVDHPKRLVRRAEILQVWECPKRIPNVRTFSAEIQAVGVKPESSCTALHCTAHCCRPSSAGVQPSEASHQPVSWVELAPQQVLFKHCISFCIASDRSFTSSKLHSEQACSISLYFSWTKLCRYSL